jgi:hypothetical protein
MTRRIHAAAAAAAGITAILLISTCGSSGEADKTPNQIVSDMAAAIKSVHSFHIHGSVTTSSGNLALDLHIVGPQTVAGTITEQNATANVILLNGAAYAKGKQFFAQFAGSQAAALIDDNWVKLPASSATGVETSFSAFTNTSTFAQCFSTLRSGTAWTKTQSTVNGTSAVELRGGGYTLDVAADGPAFPLRFTGSGPDPFASSSNPACASTSSSSGSGSLLFDGWGASSTVTPPPSPIDLSGG